MAKEKDSAAEVAEVPSAAVAAPAAQDLTLHEFCIRLSSVDKRVELIGAFHYSETASGVVKDTEAAFNARFAAFITKPV